MKRGMFTGCDAGSAMTDCHDCQQPTDDGYRCNACQEAFMAKGENRHVHGADAEYNRKRTPVARRVIGELWEGDE